MIYLAQMGENGPIKIGYSHKPYGRLAGYYGSWPYEMKVLALLKGTRVREKNLHKKFAKYRLRGEWFFPAPEILAMTIPGHHEEFMKVFIERKKQEKEIRISKSKKIHKPRISFEERKARRVEIAKAVYAGEDYRVVARKFKVSLGIVVSSCKTHSVEIPNRTRGRPKGQKNFAPTFLRGSYRGQ